MKNHFLSRCEFCFTLEIKSKIVNVVGPWSISWINYYGGPFWSKLNRIFCLRVELFVLPVYFILLYIYIVTFCRAFFSLSSVKFWHTLQIIFFTMYWLFLAPFLNNFFGTVFELFLVTLHELFLATVKLISGSVMHCVPPVTCMLNARTLDRVLPAIMKTWRNLCELELHK